jgi:uncharacterized protein (TIGR03083 family)
MGTVTRFDPVAEHERTRAALAGAVPRLVRLVRDAPDPDAGSGVPAWTVGDVGAHLAAVYLAFHSAVSGDGFLDRHDVVPAGDLSFTDRITAVNARSVELFRGLTGGACADFLAERGAVFLRDTEGLAPDTPVAVPWYGEGATLDLSVVTGLMLSESLVHGLDIARGAGLPWPIGAEEAALVIGQVMPALMALAVDEKRARGVRVAFDLVVRGGPRLAVVVEDGTATVTRDAPPRAYDCRITAEPRTFLLVAFRRVPVWEAIARGGMRAGGRRPWLAPRLGVLVSAP